ncbi:MAG: DUF3159 domain-containing protein [Anaerolineales bacterium]|nr:DUF3159 domain-containing protein [Anaerolineales bacterium]
MNKVKELQQEFLSVFSRAGSRLLDSILPLVVFLAGNPLLGPNFALWGALILAAGFALFRIVRKESIVYSLAGFGGVVLAAVFVLLSGSESGFYLPGLITTAVTIILAVVSVLINRPLVAWTSILTRRWPHEWYWRPRVLPAYNEVTIIWAVAFAAQLGLEYWFYQRQALNSLGIARLLFGWPFTIFLLVVSYLYGLWRLGNLRGPSVEEFKAGAEPPWEGQKRGF